VTPPAISVLLPVRDGVATLASALESLSAQTCEDFEIVAVDDGSRDDSAAVLARHARHEPRLHVLDGAGRGLVAALNLGLSAVRGALVARMDADDLAHPQRLARQCARFAAAPPVDVLGTRVEAIGAPAAGMRRYVAWSNALLDHDQMLRDLYVEAPLVHPSAMMRTEMLRSLAGYREFDGPEDYDLWLRAARSGARFAKLPEALVGWRDGPTRLTRTSSRYSAERFQALKIDALEHGPLASRGVVLWGGGDVAKGWSRALEQRGHRVLAFVDVHPRRIGQRLCGRPVVGVADGSSFPGALHLAAVGQPGARERIRCEAARLGLVDGRDLIAVA
jgi:glycosyltransferase involved in cell wall biosynthesis